jgi:hypothetical protein
MVSLYVGTGEWILENQQDQGLKSKGTQHIEPKYV